MFASTIKQAVHTPERPFHVKAYPFSGPCHVSGVLNCASSRIPPHRIVDERAHLGNEGITGFTAMLHDGNDLLDGFHVGSL